MIVGVAGHLIVTISRRHLVVIVVGISKQRRTYLPATPAHSITQCVAVLASIVTMPRVFVYV